MLTETTLVGVCDRHHLGAGEEWRVFDVLGNSSVGELPECIEENDIEYVFLDQTMEWSRDDQELMTVATLEQLAVLHD